MAMSAQLAGFKETREAMQELTKTVQRNVGRRSLDAAAAIIATATKSRAPVSTDPRNKTPGSLRASVQVVKSKSRVGAASGVLVADPAAVPNEYGTTKMAAQPFFRPAIDASEGAALQAFASAITVEVEKAAKRAAKQSKAKGK